MHSPNILFVVWDACRLDAARKHAPTLNDLAAENLWFENAISPAGYSLPAHVSLVTGEYPCEHGVFRETDEFRRFPLLRRLGDRGYTRYGVSANGFASPRYRFDAGFDEFLNTQGQTVYPEGLDVHRYAREIAADSEDGFSPNAVRPVALLQSVFRHEHPIKSLVNVSAAGLSELVRKYPTLQRIPHPRFDQYHEFCYSPNQNTEQITAIIQKESNSASPFFVFTNYMDAHHPYAPPEEYQREHCGRTFSYRELSRLADLTHPWQFMQQVHEGKTPSEDVLSDIRGLYAGEVHRADTHLQNLLGELEKTGQRANTVVVVTADHGENLGETDRMGEMRMGHECSASDNLLRVPLLIAHPDLKQQSIESHVSTRNLLRQLTEGMSSLLDRRGAKLDTLKPNDGIVSSQVPPPSASILTERHPELKDILERHISISYSAEWKVVMTSNEEQRAWQKDRERPIADAPDQLVERCHSHLHSLVASSEDTRKLTDAEVSHLEALGYL